MTKHYYITTPIYYVNDSPHLGHAYTTTACDVAARFMRLAGREVMFLTGTDEHGQKVDKAAANAGIDPQSFADNVSIRFRNLVGSGDNLLGVTNDDFIRTTEPRHKKAAQALWQRITEQSPDAIYKGSYSGWYSVRDEAYYQESELVDGKAPTGAEVEWVEEESYFFKLSAFQDRLLEFYEANPDFVQPRSRLNEVISFVKGGKEKVEGALKDLSISRTTFDWGVPVPGDDKHVMYVWIDALTNYLTAIGYPDESAQSFQNFWPSNQDQSPVHVVGKDILRFHAVYWPAFLMAANLPLPRHIVAHGWWTIEGEKMSKSLGNVVSPIDMINQYGRDAFRYFMLREVPFGNDGNFSQARIAEVVNADLANEIGNLSQRCLSMIFKNCNGAIPQLSDDFKPDNDIEIIANQLIEKLESEMAQFAFNKMIETILHYSSQLNQYFANQAPWQLRKEERISDMQNVLYYTAEHIRRLAISLQPFVPEAASKMLDALAVPADERSFAYLNGNHALQSGTSIEKPQAVFPRIEIEQAA